MTHTPTPFIAKNTFIVSGDDIIASCITATIDAEKGKANATHIVKCVNMHDELVEALIDIYDHADAEASTMAEKALKKAGAL